MRRNDELPSKRENRGAATQGGQLVDMWRIRGIVEVAKPRERRARRTTRCFPTEPKNEKLSNYVLDLLATSVLTWGTDSYSGKLHND